MLAPLSRSEDEWAKSRGQAPSSTDARHLPQRPDRPPRNSGSRPLKNKEHTPPHDTRRSRASRRERGRQPPEVAAAAPFVAAMPGPGAGVGAGGAGAGRNMCGCPGSTAAIRATNARSDGSANQYSQRGRTVELSGHSGVGTGVVERGAGSLGPTACHAGRAALRYSRQVQKQDSSEVNTSHLYIILVRYRKQE